MANIFTDPKYYTASSKAFAFINAQMSFECKVVTGFVKIFSKFSKKCNLLL